MEDIGLLQSILNFVAEHHQGLGAAVFFGSSLIEYVFPPFPGDAVTLFGTYLVVKGYWSFALALVLVTSGSLAGASLDYAIGRYLRRRLERLPSEREIKHWTPLTKEKYLLLNEKFLRHGAVYILINRFLPGIRPFFFVVAGAARMSFWKVLLCAAISAIAWNTLILAVGYSVGASWEKLQSFFSSYTVVAWCLLGLLGLGLLGLWVLRKRRPAMKS